MKKTTCTAILKTPRYQQEIEQFDGYITAEEWIKEAYKNGFFDDDEEARESEIIIREWDDETENIIRENSAWVCDVVPFEEEQEAIDEACIAVIMEENDPDSVIGGQDVWTIEGWFCDSTEEEIAELTERDLAESMMEMGYRPEYEIVDGAIVFPDHEVACVGGSLYRLCDETANGHIVVDSHNFLISDLGTTYATDRYYKVVNGELIDLGPVWENDMEWADEDGDVM